MHHTAGIAKVHMPPPTTRTRDQFLAMLRTPPSKPVPGCCNELFDEVDHHGFSFQGATTKSVTTGRRATSRMKRRSPESPGSPTAGGILARKQCGIVHGPSDYQGCRYEHLSAASAMSRTWLSWDTRTESGDACPMEKRQQDGLRCHTIEPRD
jgi:hypothetical protein